MTTELRIEVEWHDAPGVRDELFARTWARYEVHVGDRCLTDHLVDRSVRTGVFGSVFPLARWLVDNWYFVHHESLHAIQLRPFAAAREADYEWYRRHDVRATGDGFAWPDLLLFCDNDCVRARAFADGPSSSADAPRFLTECNAIVDVPTLQRALVGLVERTLEQCAEVDSDERREVAERWDAIRSCPWKSEGAAVLRRAGGLGLDGLTEEEVDDQLYELLRKLSDWPVPMRQDFLDGLHPRAFDVALPAVERAMTRAAKVESGGEYDRALRKKLPRRQLEQPPHVHGYEVARIARRHLFGKQAPALDALDALDEAAAERFPNVLRQSGLREGGLRALVGRGVMVLDSPASSAGRDARRFAQARALYTYWTSVAERHEPRLLSGAETHFQSAGRSFAAEWLAPAELVREHVQPEMSSADVLEVAKRFRVDRKVIEHQIENHGLATLTAD